MSGSTGVAWSLHKDACIEVHMSKYITENMTLDK